MPERPSPEIVIVVHGTFANNATWWRRGSDFCNKLDRELRDLGVAARCWGGPGQVFPEFSWSGRNSELGRETAASELADYVEAIIRTHRFRKVHFICHSHGGNVLLHMGTHIGSASLEPVMNGMKVFLGTPFFIYKWDFLTEGNSFPGEIKLMFLLCIFSATSLLFFRSFAWYVLSLFTLIPCCWFILLPWKRPPDPISTWPKIVFRSRNAIFSFASDEALTMLQTAISLSEKPPVARLGPARGEWKGPLASRNPGLYFRTFLYFSKYFHHFERNTAKQSFTGYIKLEYKAIRAFFAERRSSVKNWKYFLSSVFDFSLVIAAWPAMFTLVLVRGVLLVAIDWGLLGGVSRIAPALRRRVIRRGLKAAAETALGADRFRRTFLGVSRTPSDCFTSRDDLERPFDGWSLIKIPIEEEAAANAVAVGNVTHIVGQIYQAPLLSGGAFDLMSGNLEGIFTSMRYVHNQYYCSDWVIRAIAEQMVARIPDHGWLDYFRER